MQIKTTIQLPLLITLIICTKSVPDNIQIIEVIHTIMFHTKMKYYLYSSEGGGKTNIMLLNEIKNDLYNHTDSYQSIFKIMVC